MREQNRPPHPATVQRRETPFGVTKVPPPHPATVPRVVVQPKVARERPPHPATVVQSKPAPLGRQPRPGRLTPVVVVQAMEVKDAKEESEKKFQTAGGTFTVKSYEKYEKEGAVGAVIELMFEPASKGTGRVGLVQAVKQVSTLKSGQTVFGIMNPSIADAQNGIEIDIPRDQDHINASVSNSPVYGQLQQPATSPHLAQVPDPIGEKNKIAYIEDGKPIQPATMWDRARRPLESLKEYSSVELTFEVAALGLSGDVANQYMGSIEWGWTFTPEGGLKLKPIRIIGQQFPSPQFFFAAEAWNSGCFVRNVTQEVAPPSGKLSAFELTEMKNLQIAPELLGLSSGRGGARLIGRPKTTSYRTVKLPIPLQVPSPAAPSSSSPATPAVATSLSSSSGASLSSSSGASSSSSSGASSSSSSGASSSSSSAR